MFLNLFFAKCSMPLLSIDSSASPSLILRLTSFLRDLIVGAKISMLSRGTVIVFLPVIISIENSLRKGREAMLLHCFVNWTLWFCIVKRIFQDQLKWRGEWNSCQRYFRAKWWGEYFWDNLKGSLSLFPVYKTIRCQELDSSMKPCTLQASRVCLSWI